LVQQFCRWKSEIFKKKFISRTSFENATVFSAQHHLIRLEIFQLHVSLKYFWASCFQTLLFLKQNQHYLHVILLLVKRVLDNSFV
jgi:hypothetical protein